MNHIVLEYDSIRYKTFCGLPWREQKHSFVTPLSDYSQKSLIDCYRNPDYCRTCVAFASVRLEDRSYKLEADEFLEKDPGTFFRLFDDLRMMSSRARWLDNLTLKEFIPVLEEYIREGTQRGLRWSDLHLGICVDRGNAVASFTEYLVKFWEKTSKDYLTKYDADPNKRGNLDITLLENKIAYLEKDSHEIYNALYQRSSLIRQMKKKADWAIQIIMEMTKVDEETAHLTLWEDTSYPNGWKIGIDGDTPEECLRTEISNLSVDKPL